MSASGVLRFFVVGAPRSGTVRLESLLATHPDVAMLSRTHWLLRISSSAATTGSPRTVPIELLRSAPELVELGLDPGQIESLGDLGETPSLGAVLERIAALVAKREGCRIVGDRTEYYLRSIPLLHAALPEARVLHLIRDGRRIYRSMRTAGEVVDPCEAALAWEWSVRLGRDGGSKLPPGLYAEARHEELTNDPDRVCASVSQFLDLPPGLEPARRTRMRPEGAVARELVRLERPDKKLYEAVAGSLLDELGYPRAIRRLDRSVLETARLAREKFTRQKLLQGEAPPSDWPDSTSVQGPSRVVVEPSRQTSGEGEAGGEAEPGRRRFADSPRFFVVGAPESGAVRVGSILESHPDVAMLARTHWLLRLSSGEDLPGSPRIVAVEELLAAPELAQLELSESGLGRLRELGDHAPLGKVFECLAAGFAAARGRTVVGDRTEHYLRCLGFLHSTWPDARVIHVIRDGRRIYRSMRTAGDLTDPCQAALEWEWHVRLGCEGGRRMPRGLYAEVRHEELIADPDSGYATLSDFLGLAPHPQVAQQHLKRIQRGKTRGLLKLDAATTELFEASAGDLLDELGFRRSVYKPGREAMDRARQARERFTRARLLDGDPLPSTWPPVVPGRSFGHTKAEPAPFVVGPRAFGKRQRSESEMLAAEELPQDPVFPQLANVLDPAWLEGVLAESADPNLQEPRAWQVGFVRYRPARDLLVGYRPAETEADRPQPLLLVTAVGRQGLDRRRKLGGLAVSGSQGPAGSQEGEGRDIDAGPLPSFAPEQSAASFLVRTDAAVVVTEFPHDPVFLGIGEVLDPERLEASARRAGLDTTSLVRRDDGSSMEVASYKPASSCLVRCTLADSAGRARKVFARAYRDETGEWVHRVMTAQWKATDRPEAAGIARALGYDPVSRVLFQQAVTGELLLAQSELAALAAKVAEPLAATHATVVPGEGAPVDEPVARFSLAGIGLRAAVPELADSFDRVVEQLRRTRPTAGRVLIHGDFSPNQVLVDAGAVTILDYDLARLGDPHSDVASFMARLETQDLPEPLVRAASEGFRRAYQGQMGPLDDDRLAWYRACAFCAIAIYAVKALRPGWLQTAAGHLGRAARSLGLDSPV